jgi:hypothetical protein
MTMPGLREGQSWSEGLLKAITLPDGAFKLYVWLRLNARLDTGSLETSQQDLARALDKARGTIRANLRALEQAGVCRMEFPRNPHARGRIEITDDYWPYERTVSRTDAPELRAYLDRIRAMLAERFCVRKPLSRADELVAREWYARGVPIERVGQAILMGCGRKYVSWLNGAPRVPIGSLRYFEPILAEVEAQPAPAEYWDYIRFRIERTEKVWLEANGSDACTRPNVAASKALKGERTEYGLASDR